MKPIAILKYLIYVSAAVNMAVGTTSLIIDVFGKTLNGWREAVVAVLCIEALMVYAVLRAQHGGPRVFRTVAGVTLVVSAGMQIASVLRITGTADVARLAVGIAVTCAAFVALAVIVFADELAETPAKQTETGAKHVHIHTDNLTLAAGRAQGAEIGAKFDAGATFAGSATADALAPPEAPQTSKFCERVGCNKAAIGTRKYCSNSCRAQHSYATRRNRVAQEVKP